MLRKEHLQRWSTEGSHGQEKNEIIMMCPHANSLRCVRLKRIIVPHSPSKMATNVEEMKNTWKFKKHFKIYYIELASTHEHCCNWSSKWNTHLPYDWQMIPKVFVGLKCKISVVIHGNQICYWHRWISTDSWVSMLIGRQNRVTTTLKFSVLRLNWKQYFENFSWII